MKTPYDDKWLNNSDETEAEDDPVVPVGLNFR